MAHTHQPTKFEGVTGVISVQPVAPTTHRQLRDWNSGLCACFNDMSSCCMTVWCHFWFLSCDVAPHMGENCCTPYCLMAGGQLPHVAMRAKLRAAHGIQGSLIDDCFKSICCTYCVTCQMKRELNYIRDSTGMDPFPRA